MFLKNSESRISNSLRNFTVSIICQLLSIATKFILRTLVAKNLGANYLGLDELFTGIISVLAVSELGIGTAINFALYKPIADGDKDTISSLMQLYKKAYITIGLFILISGSIIMPFIKFIIQNCPDIEHIYLIFFIFVFDTAISYFFSYKIAFINSNQQNYIVSINHYFFAIVQSIVQIIVIIIFDNYLTYVITKSIFIILEFLTISILADKMFPILKVKTTKKVDVNTKNKIIELVKATLIVYLCSSLVTATDNILYSKLFGLEILGKISNYSIILTLVINYSNIFTESIQASIGNVIAKDTNDKKLSVFFNILFIVYFVTYFVTTILTIVFQDVIILWLGRDFTIDYIIVILLILNNFLMIFQIPCRLFIQGAGLADRFKVISIIKMIINIVISIILAKTIGVAGIIAGTVISTIFTDFLLQPIIIFNNCLSCENQLYFVKVFKYIIVLLINCILCFVSTKFLSISVLNLAIKLIIIIFISLVIFVIAYFKTDEFNNLIYILNTFKTKISYRIKSFGRKHING